MEIDTSFLKGRRSESEEGKLLDPFFPDDEKF